MTVLKKSLLLLLFVLSSVSGCYQHRWPLNPDVVSYSTFKIYMGDGQGTAWAVDEHHLVTAGHVCERGGPGAVIMDGVRRYPAKPVLWNYGSGEHDVCVLRTEFTLSRPLIIAKSMPKVGDKVAFVGYPYGEYIRSSGTFLGDTDGEESYNNAAFTAPCGPGASGSPVYTSKGVWGVLVRLRTDEIGLPMLPSDGCVAIELKELKAILDAADVDYDIPPLDTPYDIP